MATKSPRLPPGVLYVRRRIRRSPRRDVRLYLILANDEADLIDTAAQRAGLTRAGYAAEAAIAAARDKLIPLPADERERLAELLHARQHLQQLTERIGTLLDTGRASDELSLLPTARRAIDRLDTAVAALAGRRRTP